MTALGSDRRKHDRPRMGDRRDPLDRWRGRFGDEHQRRARCAYATENGIAKSVTSIDDLVNDPD